ncbi:hypothetical protein O181_091612 [Austropuccinia psidii MF-1]|uniref:Uncharacterized protein n=1 Tax=Austropuccinia psidii MF-1 TaxID=1389203 RepID=A0A9Q3IXW8_9BASI|nr:hypothetical protein [Austropuccinia psidii MF-1]
MVLIKILKKCGGKLENSLRSRRIEPCSTEEYIYVLEDLPTRTKIGRAWKNLDIKSTRNHFIKKDKQKEHLKPNKTNENFFHKCGIIGSLANNFLKNSKINEIMEKEDHNDSEEVYDYQRKNEE